MTVYSRLPFGGTRASDNGAQSNTRLSAISRYRLYALRRSWHYIEQPKQIASWQASDETKTRRSLWHGRRLESKLSPHPHLKAYGLCRAPLYCCATGCQILVSATTLWRAAEASCMTMYSSEATEGPIQKSHREILAHHFRGRKHIPTPEHGVMIDASES